MTFVKHGTSPMDRQHQEGSEEESRTVELRVRQRMGMETFSYALKCLKRGRRVARHGWNGRGMWIEMQTPGAESKMNLPYLYIEYPEGHDAYPHGCRVPWLASQTGLLAEDWFVLEEGY